ncbi:MAG: anaerobic ribonucleoside-triphosphate reductase activating protein [Oscillospiraceae bacterium]|nr:anaerobic ribonucleoside-triphosphate reductase activating protein [Oscillospiraceae bacterium]
MRIAGLVQDSIVDGPGLRFSVFTQGCAHACEGCHNPETHDFHGGTETTTDAVIAAMLSNPLTDGVTLSGGDPFYQAADCAVIARAAHEHGLDVWAYTGWTFEELLELSKTDADKRALLEETDVLVDGPFILAQRTLSLPWRGSKNQRILDVKASMAAGKAVEKE